MALSSSLEVVWRDENKMKWALFYIVFSAMTAPTVTELNFKTKNACETKKYELMNTPGLHAMVGNCIWKQDMRTRETK